MRWSIGFVLMSAYAVTVAGGPGPATVLSIPEPAFRDPQVVVATSMPPQFEIVFVRDMPTPGWRFSVDTVDVDEESWRITAKITEVGPTGVNVQMIAPTKCRVPLGKLATGVYSLELWLRQGNTGPYRLAHALVVRAR
jgi:hypothetical protein